MEIDGFNFLELDKLMRSIYVHRRVDSGPRNRMVGRVVDNVLTNTFINNISNIIKLFDPIKAENFKTIGRIFTIFNKYLCAARRLTAREIKEIETASKELKEKFGTLFPEREITPKIHMLMVHVPLFAKQYQTLGLFSEAVIESVHAEQNTIERTLYCVDNDLTQLKLSFMWSALKRDCRIPPHTPTCRRCPTCRKPIAASASSERCRCYDEPISIYDFMEMHDDESL